MGTRKSQLAKLIAFHDIAIECKKTKHGQNCIIYEEAICFYAGIKKPDFRKFNGGHNKKTL